MRALSTAAAFKFSVSYSVRCSDQRQSTATALRVTSRGAAADI